MQIEKLDVRTYRARNDSESFIIRPMLKGARRWGMFWEGDEGSDDNVLMNKLTEKEMLAEVVLALLR